MVIFNSYVKLPEGNPPDLDDLDDWEHRWKTGQADGVEKHGAWNDDHETANVRWSLYIYMCVVYSIYIYIEII